MQRSLKINSNSKAASNFSPQIKSQKLIIYQLLFKFGKILAHIWILKPQVTSS